MIENHTHDGLTSPMLERRISSRDICYGQMYGDNITQSVTISVADTHYEVGGGLSGGLTFKTTFQNSKELKIQRAGRYEIHYSISVECASANQEVEAGVMINSTCQASSTSHSNLITANRPQTLSGNTILTLAVNDVVKFCVANHTATNNLVVSHASLTLNLIV